MMRGMVSAETGAAARLAIALLAALAVLAWQQLKPADADPPPLPVETTTTTTMFMRPYAGHRDIEVLPVRLEDDAGKAGTARSVVAQRHLGIEEGVCGASPQQIRVTFDQPAEITGVDISVDIGGSLTIVEVMAAANGIEGYGDERRADPLAHASWVREPGGPMQLDKATVLPAPVAVAAGEHVTIGAYLCNVGTSGTVSPEVIVHYRWG